jgi:queuine/archaeosine tRNA-ribosyltransferase
MRSGFTFELISNPRTEYGGFGPLGCTLCKSKTTMLLKITDIEYYADMDGHNLTVCKSCLSWMMELINKGMIKEFKK